MLRSQRRRRDELRCQEIDPSTGQSCDKVFTRPWNLTRHVRDQHKDKDIVFVYYDQTTPQRKTATPPAAGAQLARSPALNPLVPVAPMQNRPAMQSPAQMNQAPWHPALTTPPQAPSSHPTMTIVNPSSATTVSTFWGQTRSASSTPGSATPTPPPKISAASATIYSPPNTPRMRIPESNLWMLEMPVPDALSTSTLPPVNRAGSIRSPAVPKPTSSPPGNRLARYIAQPDDHIAPDHSESDGESEYQTRESDAVEEGTPLQTDSTGQFEQDFESEDTASDTYNPYREEETSQVQETSERSIDTSRKRKRSNDRGRVFEAMRKPDVPTYQVKRSKKTPGQQRGLEWLSASGKAHFDETYEMFLAQWGIKAGHRGTCVLLPEDWKALDPVDLMATFQDHKPPPGGSSRAWYAYSDHATSLARAVAWYGEPRRGVDLDGFLGCGPFKPKDGSHLCHHEHCIIHLTYESAAINTDRWDCCLEARFLRQDGREVPEHCTKHSPPCLMQVSCLSGKLDRAFN